MLLVVTGASGAGKSTARRAVAPALAPEVECVELGDVLPMPAVPDIVWRHKATELAVRRAIGRQAEGRHLLLSGDPVAAGEVLAAPSADQVSSIAVCLLDLSPEAQTARLRKRGDDLSLVHHHHAFAAWMREHARDPRHMPHVISTNGWEEMRWERLSRLEAGDPAWQMQVLDTSELEPAAVAAEIEAWCRRALAGDAPVFTSGR
jgi:energy-coupling factor transporter ATP-binding protein EcfA2